MTNYLPLSALFMGKIPRLYFFHISIAALIKLALKFIYLSEGIMRSKCKVRVHLLSVILLLMLAALSPRYFPALLASVTVHELGHFIVAKARRIDMRELQLGIFGASLYPSEILFSYADEILLCAGGPALNFATAALAVHLLHFEPSSLFVMSSVSLGSLNLLPVSGFDGGRIALAALSIMLPERVARVIVRLLSFLVLFVLWCLSLYLILRRCASLSLFVFCLSVFAKIFLSERV